MLRESAQGEYYEVKVFPDLCLRIVLHRRDIGYHTRLHTIKRGLEVCQGECLAH